MELDELEKIWKQPGHHSLLQPDIEQALRHRARNEVSRMRGNLLSELWVALVSVVLVSVFYFTVLNGRLWEIGWIYILLLLVFLVYYFAKSRLLKGMLSSTGSVRQHLETQLKKLDTYTRWYMLTGTLLVPLLMTCFYFLLQYKNIPLQLQGVSVGSDSFAALYFACTAVLSAGSYFFNKWNVDVRYGKYIKRLKLLLAELDEP